MHYKGIKSILRSNIKNKVDALWTWKKGLDEEFTMIYKNYNNSLPSYTAQQLLEILNKEKNDNTI